MSKSGKIVGLAAASAVASALAMATLPAQADDHGAKNEKCYGVVKAGKNDCQTATSSCAGTSTEDGQKDAWIYVPAGTCDKLVGGSNAAG
ncbi:MAG: DUF2282 domain-containing protein [Alphaproteobacteria bacterium]